MLKKTLILPLLGLGIMSHAQTQWPAILLKQTLDTLVVEW
jgi:hypothetical protein